MFFNEKLDGELLVELGGRISKQRKIQKMSQLALAEKIGVSRKHISEIEKGKAASLLTVLKVLRVFGKYNRFIDLFETDGTSPKAMFEKQGK